MEWEITFSDLCYGDAERRAVDEVLACRWLTMGPRVSEFEQALSQRLGGAHVVAVSSCTAALHLALLALSIGPGDEVIVPSLTFAATANVAAMCGAKPVFADVVSSQEPTIDPAHVRSLVTEQTRAIIPVHYGGVSCRMFDLLAIATCGERQIAVVEDAAHAFGGEGGTGRPLGTIGAAGAFSFFSNKNLATGEGGAAVTNDPALAAKIRRMRSHGLDSSTWTRHKGGGGGAYDVIEPGLNYRPSEITAALGLAQLAKFDALQSKRKRLHETYVEALKGMESLTIPFEGLATEGRRAYHLFPVLFADATARDRAADCLRDARIQTSHHYRPLHTMSAYRDATLSLPKTEEFAARELSLPFHPNMTDSDVELVVQTIRWSL